MEGMTSSQGITYGMVTRCRDRLRGHWAERPRVPPSSDSARAKATGKSEFGNAARTQVVEMGTLGKFWHKEVM